MAKDASRVLDVLNAVMLIFCGDNDTQAGAIELWRNEAEVSKDLVLDDGYYGRTSNVFEFISRRTAFRKGTGLPGLAWETGLPVFVEDLGKGGRFLRADSALKVGINRGFAIPCSTPGADSYVMAFLSALATPIVRRFESRLPDAAGRYLRRREGFCESAGTLDVAGIQKRPQAALPPPFGLQAEWPSPATHERAGARSARARPPEGDEQSGQATFAHEGVEKGQGAIGQAFASGLPMISQQAMREPGGVGSGARAAGLVTVVALPVLRGGSVVAVVAWYF